MFMNFLRDVRANVAPIFAVAAIPLIVVTGGVVDYSRAFDQRTVVQDSLDSAALAAAKKLGLWTDTQVKTEASNFFTGNVGAKVEQVPALTPAISGSTLTLTTTLHVKTYFLGLIGLNEFVFNLSAQATQAMGTLEVALVLDNSTSMNLPSTKMSTLKTSAASLATTLWGLGTTSTKTDPVKIAVVPFAAAVNIGTSWATDSTATWLDKTGASPASGAAMEANGATGVSNLQLFNNLKDSSGNAVAWAGCVEERPSPYDVSDDDATSGTPASLYEPMFAPDEPDNWNCTASGTNACPYIGTGTAQRFNGVPSDTTPDFNNYLPDAGTAATCGTNQVNLTSVTSGTPAAFNKTSHGFTAGMSGTFASTSSLPTGISGSTTYYVSPAGLTTGVFYVTAAATGTNVTVGPANTTFTVTIANPAVFTANAHGLTAGTAIIPTGGTLPTGLTSGTTYYVTAGGLTTNTFKLSASSSATTVTMTKASPAVFTTSAAHGLAAGNAVAFSTTGALYTGLTAGTTYYVISAGLTSTKFEVSTAVGGTAVNTSGTQSGTQSYIKQVTTTGSQSGTHTYTVVGSPSVFTASSHGLSAGDAVAIASTGTLPTGLSASTIYYVVSPTTNTFALATTSGGTGVTVSGGSGTLSFTKLVATTSAGSGTISFGTNAGDYTCANGTAGCGGTGIGISETAALAGNNVSTAPLCKYGSSANKATMANITVANLTGNGKGGPNFMCTTPAITPLTTTAATITSAINAMQPNGYTNITAGLMWGWHVLSPDAPFTQGRAYSVTDNQKIIVLMTDGENTYSPYLYSDTNPASSTWAGKFVKSAYGSWNYISQGNIGTTSTQSATIFADLNAKTQLACTNAKAAGIRIYTVGFEINSQTSHDPADALALLQNCATDTTKYFNAQNEADLEAAFTAIGDDISLLRLSQ